MGIGLLDGFVNALTPISLLLLLSGRPARDRGRRPSRPGAGCDHGHSTPHDQSYSSHGFDHHAGGHLLWRHVWRIHDEHLDERSGGSCIGSHLFGRI